MLRSLLHVAINVSDLSTAEHFYGGVLGLTKVERSLKRPGAWYQLDMVQIHLIEAERDYRRLGDTQKWGQYPHMAFAIADLNAVKQRLQEAGISMQPSSSGRAAGFIQDPDGNIIELTQV